MANSNEVEFIKIISKPNDFNENCNEINPVENITDLQKVNQYKYRNNIILYPLIPENVRTDISWAKEHYVIAICSDTNTKY